MSIRRSLAARRRLKVMIAVQANWRSRNEDARAKSALVADLMRRLYEFMTQALAASVQGVE